MLIITLRLGWVIYVFATRLGGDWGGLLCLTAYVTMPAFLAFGPLVITDIVVTLFWVLTVWQLSTMWHAPTRGQVLKFGLAFAGTLLSKFSSGLMFFVFPVFALSMRLWPLTEQLCFGEDPRTIFWNCIHDPEQLQPTWDHFAALMQSYAQKTKKK